MRQILYVSKSTNLIEQNVLDSIVQRSRHNNVLDGVTGILWADGKRFAQVIEGDEQAVSDAMDRIRADRRHHDIVVLQDRRIAQRQYGEWSMKLRVVGTSTDEHDTLVRRALGQASQAIRDAFTSLIGPAAA